MVEPAGDGALAQRFAHGRHEFLETADPPRFVGIEPELEQEAQHVGTTRGTAYPINPRSLASRPAAWRARSQSASPAAIADRAVPGPVRSPPLASW